MEPCLSSHRPPASRRLPRAWRRGLAVAAALAAVAEPRLDQWDFAFSFSGLAASASARTREPRLVAARAVSDDEPLFSEDAWSDEGEGRIFVKDLEVGRELTGIVLKVVEFGCFVDVGADRNGMVHVSRISQDFIVNIDDHVEPGQMVQVWVNKVTPEGRLDLTMVNPKSDEDVDLAAWEGIVTSEEWIEGRVKAIWDYGAIVNVELPGGDQKVGGFLHISQIKDGFVDHPTSELEEGQMVKVRLLEVDYEKNRLKLTMKAGKGEGRVQAEEQDVSSLVDVSPETWFQGRVDHTAPYGAFVEIGLPGTDKKVIGLVHVSQFRDGFVLDAGIEVEVNQNVKVRIVEVSTKTGRISLSMMPLPKS
ncbi:unnamed protein product [Polarella glacialis]|uniref:S1 motif domain-containing protein n=1 Tax=Polarella glacialis TaxID=89957 RepID=A0A813GN49_POLGL|nr:unnamed protein product [Polarella glacialis]